MSRWKYAAPAAAILFVAGCAGDAGNVLAPPAALTATLSGGDPELPPHMPSTGVASDPGTLQSPSPDRVLAAIDPGDNIVPGPIISLKASIEVGDNSVPNP